MQTLFSFTIGRFVIRFIGRNARYLLLKLFGRNPSYQSLKPPVINKDNDYEEEGLKQDFYNTVVGIVVILSALLVMILIVAKLHL